MPTNSVPPPATGYWAWVREELRSKASEKWVESEIGSIKRMLDDTKVTATDARRVVDRPYVCTQEKEIEKLKTWQFKVTNWKIPVVISLVMLIVAATGQYFSLKDSVDDGNQDRAEVRKTLEKIESRQIEISKVVEEMKIHERQREKDRDEEVRMLFKQIVADLRSDTKPKRTMSAKRSRTKAAGRVKIAADKGL